MRLGTVFPQTEIGADPIVVRDYAQAVEEMGFDYLLAFDHVLGADVGSRPDWKGPYTSEHMFHEPFVLFGYLAAVTERIELVTGIVILPQRQTALVAKQAAEVDVLSRGRLRLGIGIGWNAVEYEALGENFHDRGQRSEEQVEVLRALWTNEIVDFEGRWHRIADAGLNPLPVQRPIPIWFGGYSERVLQRIGRIGDGWIPVRVKPESDGKAMIERLRGYAREAGRDPDAIGVESWVAIAGKQPEEWRQEAEAWKAAGAGNIAVNTMKAGLGSLDDHLRTIRQFREALSGI